MKHRAFFLTSIAFAGLVALPVGSSAEGQAPQVAWAPSEIAWGDAIPVFPKGAKLAILYGNPEAAGLAIVRLKMPAGYKLPPHSHPTDQGVTVISGSLAMGFGAKIDAKSAKTYGPGSFLLTPAKQHHYFIAKKETIIEVSGLGPFGLTYANPADDPSTK